MPFPETASVDDFNRGDAGTLGANYGENVIGPGLPSLGIVSNQAQQAAAFRSNYFLTSFPESQESWITVVTLAGGATYTRFFARLQNPGASYNAYFITIWEGGDFYLEKSVAGSVTTLQTLGGWGTFVNGNKIGLRCNGSTISAWRDSGSGFVQAGTDQIDSSVTGDGHFGFAFGNGTGGTFDDLGGGALAPPSAPPVDADYSRFPKHKLARV